MNPDEIVAAFGTAARLSVDLMKSQRNEPTKPLVVESKIRLEQSAMLLGDFRHAELNYIALTSGPAGFHEASARLRLYGEAFYYFAWRAREALAKCGVSFTPLGVRLVRNRMIEHPDKHDGTHILCWVTACPQGLMLEPESTEKPGADPGLYPNAQEYIEKLLPKLEIAVAKSLRSGS